jgi:hypothetical protein
MSRLLYRRFVWLYTAKSVALEVDLRGDEGVRGTGGSEGGFEDSAGDTRHVYSISWNWYLEVGFLQKFLGR